MVDQLQPLKALDQREQAVYFHARERRRSLAGMPELFRDARIGGVGGVMGVASVPGAAFTDPRDRQPITFKTAIEISGAAPTGLVFEFGGTGICTALWVDGQTIQFRSGRLTTEAALVNFDNGAAFVTGSVFEIVCAARPGSGLAQMWINGRPDLFLRTQASSGAFGATPRTIGTGSDGSFASAQNVAVTPDVTQTGAPTNFAVIEPLSIYHGQYPRQMLLPAT